MDSFMTTNSALLAGAIASLVIAISVAIRQLSLALSGYITARANIQQKKAESSEEVRQKDIEIKRLQAEAEVKDREADNDQMTQIIQIMKAQVEQGNRFALIAEDFATAQNRDHEIQEKNRLTNEKVANSMAELAKQTQAVNANIQAWPKLVDGTLDGLTNKVTALEETVRNDHRHLSELVKEEVVTRLEEIKELITTPPNDTEPKSALPPAPPKITIADAVEAHATLEFPEEDPLPKTGTDG